jgi:hypothetical protein
MAQRTGVYFLLATAVAATSQNYDAISLFQARAQTFASHNDNMNASGDPNQASNQGRCQQFLNPEDYHCEDHNRAPCSEKGDPHKRSCKRNQLRCDKSLYQSTEFYMPCCEKTNLFSMLVSIHRALCGQVDYGLFYGSLVGSMKENDLPNHDAEAELVIRSSDVQKAGDLLREAASKEGFVTTTRNGRFVINWGSTNLLHVDIWFLYEEESCAVVQRSDFFLMKFPSDMLKSLGGKECHLQGQPFPCPEQSGRVLDMMFPSWRHDHATAEEPNCEGEPCCGLIKRMPGEE